MSCPIFPELPSFTNSGAAPILSQKQNKPFVLTLQNYLINEIHRTELCTSIWFQCICHTSSQIQNIPSWAIVFFPFQNKKSLFLTVGPGTDSSEVFPCEKLCKLSRKRTHSTPTPHQLPCRLKAQPLSSAFKAPGLGINLLWHCPFLLHPSMYPVSIQYVNIDSYLSFSMTCASSCFT